MGRNVGKVVDRLSRQNAAVGEVLRWHAEASHRACLVDLMRLGLLLGVPHVLLGLHRGVNGSMGEPLLPLVVQLGIISPRGSI